MLEKKLLPSLTKYVQTNIGNQVKPDFYGTTYEDFKIDNSKLNCNSNKNGYLSEWNTCKNMYVGERSSKTLFMVKSWQKCSRTLQN